MKYNIENSMTIQFTNDDSAPEVDIFLSIMSKCYKESQKAGFKNMFDTNEKAFLKAFVEDLEE